MYSNDYTQIKNGFTNYLGACIQALPDTMSKVAKSHFVTAELMDIITKLSQKEDGNIDLFIYKPVFRSLIYVLKQEIARMESDRPYTQDAIDTYQDMIHHFEGMIMHLEEPKNETK